MVVEKLFSTFTQRHHLDSFATLPYSSVGGLPIGPSAEVDATASVLTAQSDAIAEIGSAVEWAHLARVSSTLHAWLVLMFGVVDPLPASPCAARLFWTSMSDRQRHDALAWLCLAFVTSRPQYAPSWGTEHSTGVEEAHAPLRWQRVWLQQISSHAPLAGNHDYAAMLVLVLLGAHILERMCLPRGCEWILCPFIT